MLAKLFGPLAMKVSAGIVVLLLALLAVQTVRLEGFKVWPLSIEGARPKAERLQRDLANVRAAQKQALRAAQEAKERVEREYEELAERIDDDAETARAGAMADAERFIAANRVRCEAAGSAGSGTVAATNSRGAGVPESVPAGPFVAVSDADVRACTAASSYAMSAYRWANGLADVSRP